VATVLAPQCSEQQRGDGVSKYSCSIIGKIAVAASLANKEWKNSKLENQSKKATINH